MTTKEFYMWAKYYGETYFLDFKDDLRHAVSNRNFLLPWINKNKQNSVMDYMVFPDDPIYPTGTDLVHKCKGILGGHRNG